MKLIDLSGQEVKHWKVISRVKKTSPPKWNCICQKCGSTKVIFGQLLREGRPGPCHQCGEGIANGR